MSRMPTAWDLLQEPRDLPDPTSGDLDETVPVVTVDDVFGPGWLAQHLAQINHGSRPRFADPDREARYRAATDDGDA